SQAAAYDHRQVPRRAGRLEHDCGGHQRGEGRDRRHLRALPHPDWLSRSHTARPRRDAARLRIFRAGGAGRAAKGRPIVVSAPPPVRPAGPERPTRVGGRPTTIRSLATYVPPRLLTNADLERMVDTSDEWIRQRTGIRERHIVDPGVASSDLGKEASVKAITNAGLTPDDIDVIIVGTVTPDMLFP